DYLVKMLFEHKTELASLRVSKVTTGAAFAKLCKIRVASKAIARILTTTYTSEK
ncbi:hypothetical protein Angca_003295, partial [Angiostrongylus cantonensis]